MTTATASTTTEPPRARYKRKLKNYLLDVGMQFRYTGFILVVAIFLMAIFGFKLYESTLDTSKIIFMTSMVDPTTAEILEEQFRANDRLVLYGLIGFCVFLVVSITGAGIWITHKVAGPLYNLANVCAKVRDNRLPAQLRHLRKGDELRDFYGSFREMYEALRSRVAADVEELGRAIAVLETETQPGARAEVQEALRALRSLRAEKESSLSAADEPSGLVPLK